MFSIRKSVLSKIALLLLVVYFGPVKPECATNDPFTSSNDPIAAILCSVGAYPDCKKGSYLGDQLQVRRDVKIYCTKGCNQTSSLYESVDPKLAEFAKSNPVILVHGYYDDINGWINLTSNYVACEQNTPVCMYDWGVLSKYTYNNTVRDSVPRAGAYLHSFITSLVREGARLDRIHCVGHSLGAHICGLAGKFFGPRRLGNITALDPAGPNYSQYKPFARLSKDDAIRTQAIHTNPGGFGVDFDICDSNFWPNQEDGSVNPNQTQPKCNCEPSPLRGGCSHYSSIYYWFTSIFYDFIGTKINRPPTTLPEREYFGFKYGGGVGEYGAETLDTYPYKTIN